MHEYLWIASTYQKIATLNIHTKRLWKQLRTFHLQYGLSERNPVFIQLRSSWLNLLNPLDGFSLKFNGHMIKMADRRAYCAVRRGGERRAGVRLQMTFPTYEFCLQDGLNKETTGVEIKVADIQNSPPEFLGPLIGVVREDDPIGTLVMTVRARDGDRGMPRKMMYELVTSK